jgi:hypothetical protein
MQNLPEKRGEIAGAGEGNRTRHAPFLNFAKNQPGTAFLRSIIDVE